MGHIRLNNKFSSLYTTGGDYGFTEFEGGKIRKKSSTSIGVLASISELQTGIGVIRAHMNSEFPSFELYLRDVIIDLADIVKYISDFDPDKPKKPVSNCLGFSRFNELSKQFKLLASQLDSRGILPGEYVFGDSTSLLSSHVFSCYSKSLLLEHSFCKCVSFVNDDNNVIFRYLNLLSKYFYCLGVTLI